MTRIAEPVSPSALTPAGGPRGLCVGAWPAWVSSCQGPPSLWCGQFTISVGRLVEDFASPRVFLIVQLPSKWDRRHTVTEYPPLSSVWPVTVSGTAIMQRV